MATLRETKVVRYNDSQFRVSFRTRPSWWPCWWFCGWKELEDFYALELATFMAVTVAEHGATRDTYGYWHPNVATALQESDDE